MAYCVKIDTICSFTYSERRSIMNIRRILALLLAVMLLFAVGCSSEKPSSNNGSSAGSEPIPETERYRGSTVTFATYFDPYLSIDRTDIDTIEEKYGIKTEYIILPRTKKTEKLAAAIANNTPPDFCYIGDEFPKILSVLQPLEAAKLDLSKDFVDQSIIRASTVGGKPYLVNGIGTREEYLDVCVYNKYLFEENKITTPKEFYEKGEWTLDNFKWCAEQISALGKDYTGATLLSDSVFALSGSSPMTLSNDKFTVSLDQKLYDVMDLLSNMKQKGLITLSKTDFDNDKCGMAITNSMGLNRIGYFFSINPDHIGATMLPKLDKDDKHTVTSALNGYALVAGAKNPEAAGLAMKIMLHFERDDDATYYTYEVADFYKTLYKDYADEIIYYFRDATVSDSSEEEYILSDTWNNTNPQNMKKVLDGKTELLKERCDEYNSYIDECLKKE